jgi:anion-transporting  ArsA/GET3 family ATPase
MKNFGFAGCPDKAKIVICCGSGGVGKTTISSAVGLRGALSGRKTIILTIDPAKRLADALGLESFRTDIQQVPVGDIQSLPNGALAEIRLDVLMLDAKNTFDGLIQRYAPDDLVERILLNRYYQYLSSNMAGSHEYMAMEKLYEIYHQGDYDLIVLDTPPSRRALDFLDAPRRLLNLLGHDFFRKWFTPYVKAGRWSSRFFNMFASPFLIILTRMIGKQALVDFTGFVQLWNDVLFDGFTRRAKAVRDLLAGDQTCFLAVATPQKFPLTEAVFFHERIMENKMHFGGFIINRMHGPASMPGHDVQGVDIRSVCKATIPPELLPALLTVYENSRALVESDMKSLEWLRGKAGRDTEIMQLLLSEHEISGLDDLYALSLQLDGNQSC